MSEYLDTFRVVTAEGQGVTRAAQDIRGTPGEPDGRPGPVGDGRDRDPAVPAGGPRFGSRRVEPAGTVWNRSSRFKSRTGAPISLLMGWTRHVPAVV